MMKKHLIVLLLIILSSYFLHAQNRIGGVIYYQPKHIEDTVIIFADFSDSLVSKVADYTTKMNGVELRNIQWYRYVGSNSKEADLVIIFTESPPSGHRIQKFTKEKISRFEHMLINTGSPEYWMSMINKLRDQVIYFVNKNEFDRIDLSDSLCAYQIGILVEVEE